MVRLVFLLKKSLNPISNCLHPLKGFIALVVCLASIFVAALGLGVNYFFLRTPQDPHSHNTLPTSSTSSSQSHSPSPPQPSQPQLQPQSRWLGILPVSFRSKPAGDLEHGTGGRKKSKPLWRKGSKGSPGWAQASSGDEWDIEDEDLPTLRNTGGKGMRLTDRNSMVKSEFESISEEGAEDSIQYLKRGSGSSASSKPRPRSRSPPGTMKKQMQKHSIDSAMDMHAYSVSPEPYASTEGHSNSGSREEERDVVELNMKNVRHFSTQSEGSVSTRTSHTGTKFVEGLE